MSNLGQGYWECRRVGGTQTRDKGEKERKHMSLHICGEFHPVFVLRVAGLNTGYYKIEMGPIRGLVGFWCKSV
jgi:hypothetical protein